MAGEAYFELMLFNAIGLIFFVHVMYLTMTDFDATNGDDWWTPVLPLFPFGFGHALFTTIQSPIVPKVVKKEEYLPRTFTYVKITESLAITLFIQFAGYIRQQTGGFTGVLFMLLICAAISMAGSFFLMQETKAVGGHMFDVNTYKETYNTLKMYWQKLTNREIDHSSPLSVSKGHDAKATEGSSSDSDSPEKSKQGGKRMHIGSTAIDQI